MRCRTEDVDCSKKCYKEHVLVRNVLSGKAERVNVWANEGAKRIIDANPDYVFEGDESFVFCRHEEMYGIPRAEDSPVCVIVGAGSFPRRELPSI